MVRLIEAPTPDDALAFLGKDAAEKEARGEKNLIFCEDGLTLLAERAVLAPSGGTFLTEVSTFARFLSGERRVLSKHGSVMAVSAILSEAEGRLGCFSARAAEAVYETIAQLSASRVSAEMLREGAAQTDGMLRVKLTDLALVLDEYTAFLHRNGLLDENGYLALLPEKIASGALADTNVTFFAFPSFTRQAAEGVRAACLHARSVTGVFLAGAEALYTGEGARIFRSVAREADEVSETRLACSLEGDARVLHGGLFSPDHYVRGGKRPSQSVFAFTAADESEEAERVAALVKKSAAEGARWREIAVLVPDEGSFAAMGKAFSAQHIPYTADVKRPFSRHPFCAFVLSVLAAVADGCLPASVDAALSNVCFGESDIYRNYLMKYGGWRGGARRAVRKDAAGFEQDIPELERCREKLLNILACFPRSGKGSAFVRGVRDLAALVGAERVCETLAARFEGAEKSFLSLAPLENILSETETVAGGRTFTAREFAALFESGTNALKCAMIPAAADAVFVGDATKSRFARVKTLFLTGLTDELPAVSADTAVITDGEIGRLSSLSVEIEPAIAVVNARARESLALNACAFSRSLFLSRPLRKRGEETAASELTAYVSQLLTPAPAPSAFPYDCAEALPAQMRLLAQRAAFEEGRSDDASAYASLYEALKRAGEGDRLAAAGGAEKPSVPEAGRLYFASEASPTLLESYFACPYAGFLKNVLRLKEREERPVLARDTGDFVHAVLDMIAPRIGGMQSEEACRKEAVAAGRSLLESPRYAAFADTGSGAYAAERLLAECAEIAAAAYRQLKGSAFRVKENEGTIRLPDLHMKGRIDRVDEAEDYVRVIDYKTGHFDPAPAAYYTGRSLQLELYLLAAADGKKPAGAFYFPAEDKFTAPEDAKFRMQGFFNRSERVRALMDVNPEGESAFFESNSRRGMDEDIFTDFLSYARLVAARAEEEMAGGNVRPSPYEGACDYCAFCGACGFVGAPRKETGVTCEGIAAVARAKGGKE